MTFEYELVIPSREARTMQCSLTETQTLVIQSPLKIWQKLRNTLNVLQKFTQQLPVMLYIAVR